MLLSLFLVLGCLQGNNPQPVVVTQIPTTAEALGGNTPEKKTPVEEVSLGPFGCGFDLPSKDKILSEISRIRMKCSVIINYHAILGDGKHHRVGCIVDPTCSNPQMIFPEAETCLQPKSCCDMWVMEKRKLPDSPLCPSNDRIALKDLGRYMHKYRNFSPQEVSVLYEFDGSPLHQVTCKVNRECRYDQIPKNGLWSSEFGCIDLSECCDRGIPKTEAELKRLGQPESFDEDSEWFYNEFPPVTLR